MTGSSNLLTFFTATTLFTADDVIGGSFVRLTVASLLGIAHATFLNPLCYHSSFDWQGLGLVKVSANISGGLGLQPGINGHRPFSFFSCLSPRHILHSLLITNNHMTKC